MISHVVLAGGMIPSPPPLIFSRKLSIALTLGTGGGHYYCFVLDTVSCLWQKFDDEFVSVVKIEEVLQAQAYMLFYVQRNAPSQVIFCFFYLFHPHHNPLSPLLPLPYSAGGEGDGSCEADGGGGVCGGKEKAGR